jgi:signal transduction histidine kinase
MFVSDLIVASLLYAQGSVFRSRALIVLASGYLFAALMLVPHALTFPGAFAPDGLLGGGINTTSWIYMSRRAGLLVGVIAYCVFKRADLADPAEGPPPRIALAACAGVLLAAAMTALTIWGESLLPSLYVDRYDADLSNMVRYNIIYILAGLACLIMLGRDNKSLLDVWLIVATLWWSCQSFLIMFASGRFTLGFYYQFLLVFASSIILMLALIAESNRLYARLALARSAEAREREARLTSLDALVAAISHEAGQPLTAVILNTNAALALLPKSLPGAQRLEYSMRAVLDDATRTFDVIKSIRAMFTRQPGTTAKVDLNDLARETVSILQGEIAAAKLALKLDLGEDVPPILANQVQIQQVLINLLHNSIESVAATPGRLHQITIATATAQDRCVVLKVSDTGAGIAADKLEQIFEAFFTTKATGTGLGLAIARAIVDEHGGRLWADPNDRRGATFWMELPCSGFANEAELSFAAG